MLLIFVSFLLFYSWGLLLKTQGVSKLTMLCDICKLSIYPGDLSTLTFLNLSSIYPLFSIMHTFLSTGQHCTEDVNECRLQPNTCQNGGTCSNEIGGYRCVCVNGWSGLDCSENIDDCDSAACSPGSTCVDRVASFVCLCPYGKTGRPQRANYL